MTMTIESHWEDVRFMWICVVLVLHIVDISMLNLNDIKGHYLSWTDFTDCIYCDIIRICGAPSPTNLHIQQI